MIMLNESFICENLYLFRENKTDLFLNNCQLIKQHQVEALRFLFKQFKKKNPAAAVNFPPQCGKSVTIALFLQAIYKVIKNPILILCNNKSDLNTWKDIILQWTEFTSDDIAIESPNVYVKKKIFLKYLDDILPYQRRNWSILVIKDDLNKNTLKLSFDADFKIWLTSTDVKKDLNMLSLTYNWLTKGQMNAKDFLSNGNTLKERIQKTILLDSFLEDFLIQETRIEPLKSAQDQKSSTITVNKEVTAKSRKNKDATGTKIKRSKRVLEDGGVTTEGKRNEARNNGVCNENDEFQFKKLKLNIVENQLNEDNGESQTILQNYNNVISANTMVDIHSSEQLSFGEAIEDIVRNENVPSNKSTESLNFESQSIINEDDVCYENKEDNNVDEENIDGPNQFEPTSNTDSIVIETSRNDVNLLDRDGKCGNDVNDVTFKSIENIKEEKVNNGDSVKINEDGTDVEIKTGGHKSIDSMISELEEKTLKKFKGSLLDAIF